MSEDIIPAPVGFRLKEPHKSAKKSFYSEPCSLLWSDLYAKGTMFGDIIPAPIRFRTEEPHKSAKKNSTANGSYAQRGIMCEKAGNRALSSLVVGTSFDLAITST